MQKSTVAMLATLSVIVAGGVSMTGCEPPKTPTPAVTVTPLQTARQDAPRQHGMIAWQREGESPAGLFVVYLPRCPEEDGGPEACVWIDPDTGTAYVHDGSNYRS